MQTAGNMNKYLNKAKLWNAAHDGWLIERPFMNIPWSSAVHRLEICYNVSLLQPRGFSFALEMSSAFQEKRKEGRDRLPTWYKLKYDGPALPPFCFIIPPGVWSPDFVLFLHGRINTNSASLSEQETGTFQSTARRPWFSTVCLGKRCCLWHCANWLLCTICCTAVHGAVAGSCKTSQGMLSASLSNQRREINTKALSMGAGGHQNELRVLEFGWRETTRLNWCPPFPKLLPREGWRELS